MTEPTDALIPCPFCGSPDVAIADDLVTFNGLCNACGASGGYSSHRNGATWLWNRRTPHPTQAQAGAVPLTDEQLAEMMRETWGCASIAPRHAMKFARAIEAAHGIGIKGGLHGAK